MAKAMYNIVDGKTRKIKKQYAVVASNNLFDINEWKNSITLTSNISIIGTTITLTNYAKFPDNGDTEANRNGYQISVEPDTAYTMSWGETTSSGGTITIFMYGDTDSTFVWSSSGSKQITFTAPTYAKFVTVRFDCQSNKMTLSNIQLEKGSTATEYKPFTGPNGITRKIKKMYAVVGGLLKLIFGQGELKHYGTATPLSARRTALAATSVGNYALFGGGDGYSSDGLTAGYASNVVDAYDTNLTRTVPEVLSYSRAWLSAASIGNYALFAGGSNFYSRNAVDVYDASLTKQYAGNLSTPRRELAATSTDTLAIFAGGYNIPQNGDSTYVAVVDAYDTSLTCRILTPLSTARSNLTATSIGEYVLVAGGYPYTTSIDAYDCTTNTKISGLSLATARSSMAATTVGGYALFAGGIDGSSRRTSVVEVFDSSLTRIGETYYLTQQISNFAATTVGDYALFGGGLAYIQTGSSGDTTPVYVSVVDAFDSSLVKSTPTELSEGRCSLAATTVGDYALFGGGATGSYLDTVDVYQV